MPASKWAPEVGPKGREERGTNALALDYDRNRAELSFARLF